jgi:hypothetical protein
MPNFEELFNSAHSAGMNAGTKNSPEPMVVVQRANPLDDSSPVVKQYPVVMDGLCGFAWVTVRPANCGFAKWLKENKRARKGYHGGIQYWVHEFNQSISRKEAYANAFAAVLKAAGIDACSESRLD